jgi:hypothetical protein
MQLASKPPDLGCNGLSALTRGCFCGLLTRGLLDDVGYVTVTAVLTELNG